MNKPISKEFAQLKSLACNGDFDSANKLVKKLDQISLGPAAKSLLEAICLRYNLEMSNSTAVMPIEKTKVIDVSYADIKTLAQLDEQPVNEGISIVSCCMNRNENLRKALITWLQLDVDEIVIVDWSSKEPVEETIKDLMDHRVKIIRVEGESKWVLTYGFNVGLRFTRYSKVFKFDADIQVTSDFLEKNNFLQGEFCRGSWKLASDSGNDEQKFVNGSFGAFKKDLLEIGYYNEFIRTYGYDDSDIYGRLTANAGLAQKFIEPSSILHLDQKEELRLINQNIAKQQFLDCYNATELYNLINKNISQLYDFWFPANLQSYAIENKKDNSNLWLADRVGQHAYIPAYIQTDAISYAVIQLLTWKFNAWVWLSCDIKSLAMQLYADHKRQIPFNCSKTLLGLDKSLPVFFIGENNFLSSIASIDRDCDIAECCLVTSTGESYGKIKNFSKSYTVVGYGKDDYEKLKQLRSDITCEKNDCYEPVVDENNGRLFATSVYDEKVPHRMQEYLECFGRNIAEFDILALYYEEQNGAFLEGAKELYEELKHSGHSLAQVFFISIDYRPTFRSIFDSIDLYFPGVTAFVSNADIAFDDTIKLVQGTDLDDVFLVLSRKEVVPKSHTDDGLIMNQFGVPNTFSADVWIYKAPLKYDFKADFPIGSFHCDSFMNFYLGKSDYRLYNPCLSVNCFHIHDPVFNSSEEKEIVLRETIQKKLDEEIIACGGEFPLRGVQWCRITDVQHPARADMTLMWSDMIINFDLKSDGSNVLAVLIQVIIALKINSKVLAGHIVNINMPHDMCHSDIAEIMFHFRQFINSSLLTIGVSNKGKDELFAKELPHYQKVVITPETLITSYQSAILETPGSIYDSNTEYYVKDGVFGVGHTPALLCQSGTEEINDIEIYCLLKCLNTDDKQLLQNYFTTSIDAGFMQFYPFFHEINLIVNDEPEFNILQNLKSAAVVPTQATQVTYLTSIYKGDEYFQGFLENITPSLIEANGMVILVNANSPGNERGLFNDFIEKYPGIKSRIKYIHLEKDPGLYNCWQLAIEQSDSHYVGNANLDDRRSPFQSRVLLQKLESEPTYYGAAAAISANTAKNVSWFNFTDNQYWFTYGFNEKVTFDDLHTTSENGNVISRNIMHCMPIWRKSLHDEHGYFNEEKYGTSADWAFWLECTKHGKTFCLVPELYSQYYINEQSHNRINDPNGIKENKIIEDYLDIKQARFIQQ